MNLKQEMMKKIGLMLTALLMVCGVAMAQGPRGDRNMDPKQRAQQMTEQMVKDYSLTDAQKEKVQALNLDMSQKMSEIKGDDRDARRTQMQKIRDDYQTKLKGVLTDEQYKKFEKAEKERPRGPRN